MRLAQEADNIARTPEPYPCRSSSGDDHRGGFSNGWWFAEGIGGVSAGKEGVPLPLAPRGLPAPERIATFDNDGTRWAEQPVGLQLLFAVDRVKALRPRHGERQNNERLASTASRVPRRGPSECRTS